jgi:hypothetical protein
MIEDITAREKLDGVLRSFGFRFPDGIRELRDALLVPTLPV